MCALYLMFNFICFSILKIPKNEILDGGFTINSWHFSQAIFLLSRNVIKLINPKKAILRLSLLLLERSNIPLESLLGH